MTDTQLREELNHLRRSMRELIRAGLNLTAYVEGVCNRGGGTKSAMRAFSGEFNRVAAEASVLARRNDGGSRAGAPDLNAPRHDA